MDLSGFGFASDISRIVCDAGLLHALVERWRPETHTFHLRWGEMTVTLRDVQLLMGLRVTGPAVTDSHYLVEPDLNLVDVCTRLLGHTPTRTDGLLSNNDVSLSWLKRHFMRRSRDADWIPETEELAIMRARGYILHMIDTFLFPGTSGNRISLDYLPLLENLHETAQYSWGSAVLSYLYNGLCKATEKGRTNAAGCAVLLQV